MKTRVKVASVMLLLTACTVGSSSATPSSQNNTNAASTTAPASTTASTSASGSTQAPSGTDPTTGAGCPGDGELIDDGRVAAATQPASDAELIGLVSWDTSPACERFVIELVTAEGAPATTPPSFTADFMREIGVLRIDLDVEATAITDQLVESVLVDRFYVVRQMDGTLFLDLVLTAPARARATSAGSPGVVVVELEPGGADYVRTPLAGGLFVVTSPGEGVVESPIPIRGYGRPFEASVVMQILQGGGVVTEAVTNSADYIDTWGEFTFDLEADAKGPAELFVGEMSAEDGSPRGVLIPIDLP